MGRAMTVCMAVLTVGALTACSSPEEVAEDVGVAQNTPTPPTPSKVGDNGNAQDDLERRTAAGFKAVNFTEDENSGGGSRDFEYSWPAQVSAIPELTQHLQSERATALEEQKQDWAEMLADAPESCGASCKTNSYGRTWKVVADLPRFLSLSANQYAYTGGAHGNYWFDSLVWDRDAKAVLDPRAMFTSTIALNDAVRDSYCSGLKIEQTERRGGDVDAGIFSDCPKVDDLTLLVGSSNGKSFDRLGLLAAPYVAGPYVEGAYEVTVPVTQAVLDAVKSEYRASFSVK